MQILFDYASSAWYPNLKKPKEKTTNTLEQMYLFLFEFGY